MKPSENRRKKELELEPVFVRGETHEPQSHRNTKSAPQRMDRHPAFVPLCLCGEIVRLWSLPCTIPNPVNHKGTETQRTIHGGEARWGSASFVPLCLCGESSGLSMGALGLAEIQSFLHQRFADQDCIRSVDLKDIYSGPTQRRQPDELGLFPSEVLNPAVAARMKQADHLACGGINPGKVRPLVFVAAQTRPREIGGHRRPAVLLRDDVIHLEPQFSEPLRELTILAAKTSAQSHLSLEPRVHERASGGRPRPFLRRPGFGLQKLQRAADGHVIVQFPFLLGGQATLPRLGCKFIGPVQIAQRELQSQECPGFGRRETPHLRLDRPLPNGDRGVVGDNCIHRPSPCPVPGAFQARIPPHFTGGSGGRGENEFGCSETIHSPRIGEPQRHGDTKSAPQRMDRHPAFVPLCLCGEIVRLWSLPCTIPNPVNHLV